MKLTITGKQLLALAESVDDEDIYDTGSLIIIDHPPQGQGFPNQIDEIQYYDGSDEIWFRTHDYEASLKLDEEIEVTIHKQIEITDLDELFQ